MKGAGGGVKGEATLAYQATRRGQVEAIVTDEKWEASIRSMLRQIQKGNVKAFLALAPWVMGAEPKAVSIELSGEIAAKIYSGFDPGKV